MEANHPIYKVKRVGSGKEGWIHHNRLRKKENFLIPKVQTKFSPQHHPMSSTPVVDQDDDISEIDFPLIITNSHIPRASIKPTPPVEAVDHQEPFEQTPVISLDGTQTGTQAIEVQAATLQSQV